MVSMLKHHKPHSWLLLQLALIWIQLEAGSELSQRHGETKSKKTQTRETPENISGYCSLLNKTIVLLGRLTDIND